MRRSAFAATVILGVALNLTLGEYLLRLGVPVLPAGLDVLDIAGGKLRALASKKVQLEAEVKSDELTRVQSTGEPPKARACR